MPSGKCQVGRKCQGALKIQFIVLREDYSEEIIFLEIEVCKQRELRGSLHDGRLVTFLLSCLNLLICQREQLELVISNFPSFFILGCSV